LGYHKLINSSQLKSSSTAIRRERKSKRKESPGSTSTRSEARAPPEKPGKKRKRSPSSTGSPESEEGTSETTDNDRCSSPLRASEQKKKMSPNPDIDYSTSPAFEVIKAMKDHDKYAKLADTFRQKEQLHWNLKMKDMDFSHENLEVQDQIKVFIGRDLSKVIRQRLRAIFQDMHSKLTGKFGKTTPEENFQDCHKLQYIENTLKITMPDLVEHLLDMIKAEPLMCEDLLLIGCIQIDHLWPQMSFSNLNHNYEQAMQYSQNWSHLRPEWPEINREKGTQDLCERDEHFDSSGNLLRLSFVNPTEGVLKQNLEGYMERRIDYIEELSNNTSKRKLIVEKASAVISFEKEKKKKREENGKDSSKVQNSDNSEESCIFSEAGATADLSVAPSRELETNNNESYYSFEQGYKTHCENTSPSSRVGAPEEQSSVQAGTDHNDITPEAFMAPALPSIIDWKSADFGKHGSRGVMATLIRILDRPKKLWDPKKGDFDFNWDNVVFLNQTKGVKNHPPNVRYYDLIQNATEAWELYTRIAKQEKSSETSVRANNTLKKIVVKIMVNIKFYTLKNPPPAERSANDLLKYVFEETQFVHIHNGKTVFASTQVLYEKIRKTLDSKLNVRKETRNRRPRRRRKG